MCIYAITNLTLYFCTTGALLMLSVGGLCPGLQASNNPGLLKIVSGCFGLPLGNVEIEINCFRW